MTMRARRRSGPLADTIREDIKTGKYPPGTAIPSLTQLQRETGYSVTTIRRAIAVLAAEGLVEIVPGRGTFAR